MFAGSPTAAVTATDVAREPHFPPPPFPRAEEWTARNFFGKTRFRRRRLFGPPMILWLLFAGGFARTPDVGSFFVPRVPNEMEVGEEGLRDDRAKGEEARVGEEDVDRAGRSKES